jgi:hypothetical protein
VSSSDPFLATPVSLTAQLFGFVKMKRRLRAPERLATKVSAGSPLQGGVERTAPPNTFSHESKKQGGPSVERGAALHRGLAGRVVGKPGRGPPSLRTAAFKA